ncbi:DUF2927 domain-containing protein [Pseudosulfitobacter pseudonitzschiae]|nr:DUF2927 domain-containing protein [Pseudosulfitobacter pseudonitzschiae]MCA0134388.1 DUF2927 domain-containing protein [Pseudosulfitobacter pseudonitzschiae]MCD2325982.1 DUF2927 domain-containing protein [Pseudosulfitobacter pseudonitzschiae]MCD2350398.1 DUF2927 domain-containing protein [Pseudosulfitobacter pseudonitzschiae]MCI2215987.1 DUF2927 domain-containing protein [Pseudosulfitobacter pseudonitzschiae]UFE28809.1 DUF2927 domain-containing protein [Pseudosulfitobacter pseudonitzschiae]
MTEKGATRWIRGLGVMALGLLAVACDIVAPVEPVLTPRARPDRPAAPIEVAKPTSERSAAKRSYLARVQSAQLSQGLLRQDGGGPDTPFSPDMLARNFNQIVFYNEYGAGNLASGVSGNLRRWAGPVRMGVDFGGSVPASQQRQDRSDVTRYAARLAQATGHPVTMSNAPNFMVLFVSEDDRAEVLARQAARIPGITKASLAPLLNLGDDIYCAVAAYATGPDPHTYTAAIAVIRAENPDLMRLSCIHEELAQGLGAANDSPQARPSIFNDDDEFALLTDHDEMLLGMLYDPRLKIGMTLPEAEPIVRILARERTGGPI